MKQNSRLALTIFLICFLLHVFVCSCFVSICSIFPLGNETDAQTPCYQAKSFKYWLLVSRLLYHFMSLNFIKYRGQCRHKMERTLSMKAISVITSGMCICHDSHCIFYLAFCSTHILDIILDGYDHRTLPHMVSGNASLDSPPCLCFRHFYLYELPPKDSYT